MKKMAAGSFKTHCLAVMDEVQAKREAVVITKHGKPVVKLIPVSEGTDDIYNFLAGQGRRHRRRRFTYSFSERVGRA